MAKVQEETKTVTQEVTNEEPKNKKLTIEDFKNKNIDYDKAYLTELKEFAAANPNKIKLPSEESNLGKAINVLSRNPNCYIEGRNGPDGTDAFAKELNLDTTDSIQCFNKIEQKGLKCIPGKGKYGIVYPLKLQISILCAKDFQTIFPMN